MVIRMRHTKSHRNNRRSHHSLEKPAISHDENKTPHLRHRASSVTGTYRGRQVINVEKKLIKKIARVKAKEENKGNSEVSSD